MITEFRQLAARIGLASILQREAHNPYILQRATIHTAIQRGPLSTNALSATGTAAPRTPLAILTTTPTRYFSIVLNPADKISIPTVTSLLFPDLPPGEASKKTNGNSKTIARTSCNT